MQLEKRLRKLENIEISGTKQLQLTEYESTKNRSHDAVMNIQSRHISLSLGLHCYKRKYKHCKSIDFCKMFMEQMESLLRDRKHYLYPRVPTEALA